MPTLAMITFDSTDPRALAAWWATRLGGEITLDADGFFCIVTVPEWTTSLGFQLVESPTPGKNRAHLDLGRDEGVDRAASVASWIAGGARHLGERGEGDFRWDTFADPDGNEFCVSGTH
ncbi:VOC family protein [Nocardioides daejeonensis]|uniref:VOC family protein n=1 Tax=Nocardioides daejeonensis TaxID=1046556 RepID=UPI000D740BDF|nr:VOC family protein [Nocardioides daejeonensis]